MEERSRVTMPSSPPWAESSGWVEAKGSRNTESLAPGTGLPSAVLLNQKRVWPLWIWA